MPTPCAAHAPHRTYRVVWFKRDLRVHDHAALAQAAAHGPVLCLYVLEPSLWAQPDAAAQHLAFIHESLRDLHRALKAHGGQLHLRVGEVTDVLAELHAQHPFEALHAHEETGNAHTYARDLAVGRWCRDHGVGWHEVPQFGVVRRLKSRNTWQPRWEALMSAPTATLPALRFFDLPAWGLPANRHRWPTPESLGLDTWQPPQRQPGGEPAGLAVLADFLDHRSAGYRGGISSPLRAPDACSRLSAHLAYGTVSLRHVVQATRARAAELPAQSRQRQGLNAFLSRLYWHCHFIQKLESEPELEWRNLHRGYDGLREPGWNPAHFEALSQGRTGWPMVDACVAMLRHTGWLNFRMRAMLVSVAAYPLWLHWRGVGLWLAREFLDYEPGIHWSQLQMQSGTTGINTTRVYNPIKQAQDHDPHGHFVRQWLPAMRRVPDSWLFEPWRMPESVQAACGVRVGHDIPLPVVDLATATREAKARLHGLRAQPDVKAAKAAIVDKHGSRKGMPGRTRRTADGHEAPARPRASRAATQPSDTPQLSLDLNPEP
ncbi:MAG: FAD-binding domain-containing protein [Burkholderiaceae bacterium]